MVTKTSWEYELWIVKGMKEEMRKRLSINDGNSSLFILFLGYVGVL